MSDFSYDYSVLIIVEPDFHTKSKNTEVYFERLSKFLSERSSGQNLRIVTVTGRYGIDSENKIEVDDKSKTVFIKSLEDHLYQFNETVIIANFVKDPYIDALSNRLTDLSKSLTIYGYETQGYEKS